MNRNILFYSRTCPTCCNLLRVLQNEKLLCYFNLICVDDNLDKIPPQITIVPTMIVSTINRPLVAKETFEWVNRVKFIRQQNINANYIKRHMWINNKGALPWIQGEMSGLSDSYAYTNVDKAQSHTYFDVGSEKVNAIFTAEEQPKINKREQDERIQELKNRRKGQDEIYSDFYKREQLKAVSSAEEKKF